MTNTFLKVNFINKSTKNYLTMFGGDISEPDDLMLWSHNSLKALKH